MGTEIVPHAGSPPVAYYYPVVAPQAPPHVIERQVIIIREQSGGALKDFAKVLAGAASVLAALGALLGVPKQPDPVSARPPQYSTPQNQQSLSPPRTNYPRMYHQPRQPVCYLVPRREYLGRFTTYVETLRVPNGYGGWRLVERRHWEDRFRNYSVRVCS